MAEVEVENNRSTILSLFQMASIVYLREQRVQCDPQVKQIKRLLGGVKRCCKRLLRIIEKRSANVNFDPQRDRRRVYEDLKDYISDTYWNGLLSSAIRNGHVKCMAMAEEMGYPLAMDYLVPFITRILIKKPYLYLFPHITLDVCSVAAYFGQLDCLEYAHRRGVPWDIFTCVMAVLGGSFKCLKFAVNNGCPIDESNPVEAAVSTGNLQLLDYLHKKKCPWSLETCVFAAHNGQLECLKYARDHGCPWDVRTCIAAVEKNHFGCLRYAVDNGCPMTSTAPTYTAARLGRLGMLKYLHDHGCPWSEEMCIDLAFKIKDSILLLQEQGLENQERTHIHKQILNCLVYAWKNGCPWPNATCFAGSGNGRMDCLVSEPDHLCMWDSSNFGGYANVAIRQRKTKKRLKGPITSDLLEPLIVVCITVPRMSIRIL